MEEYVKIKEKVVKDIQRAVGKNILIDCNTLDNPAGGKEENVYLTVTGLSAEHGDDGNTGRGNKPCGLITPCREMSLEACAGKNINHPGKLYQVLAHIIADRIAKINGVQEVSVKLMSEIGKPLDDPQVASINLVTDDLGAVRGEVRKVADSVLDDVKRIQRGIVKGRYALF